ncbi:MTRF1L release factor glutamine methyltransferase isoform X2 [Nematostella vectensis]|uniref:MTRF1L release factor glutamine methyltransferase isoform X2 n=1 Tax=Nematostella vectensis TaxID=45351 RepID=UPI0013904CBE|nr:MTRF1L release factor glutamine methyltransferase isoform X2 [Nematostella vectensis]
MTRKITSQSILSFFSSLEWQGKTARTFASSCGRDGSKRTELSALAQKWCKQMKESGVDDAVLSFNYIAQKVLGDRCKPCHYGNKEMSVSASQVHLIEEMCQRRANREPIQYIVGDWDFRFLTLQMQAPVLIPRPETELVELINNHLKSSTFAFLDVGSGSGAICLSLLSENEKASGVAIDVSPVAVKLTRLNAHRCGMNCRLELYHCPIEYFQHPHEKKFDMIVSNPPYIPEHDMTLLQPEVASYEDRQALCGGKDGMDVIRQILAAAPQLLNRNGSIWLETDLTHPPLVRDWLESRGHLGLTLHSVYKDFTNRPRFCHIVFK